MAARALILLLAACAGPAPSVEDVAVAPSPLPGHVRVTGTLINRAGPGDVELHVVLRGAVVVREDQMVGVESHETLAVTIDVAAPPRDYSATIVPEYPN